MMRTEWVRMGYAAVMVCLSVAPPGGPPQAQGAEYTTPRALAVGDTYQLNVDGYTGDEATTQPKTDANDGLNGDNPYFRRTNVARAHDGGGGPYWYTSSYQNEGEPNPCGPQYVDYQPPLDILGGGRYRIIAEYRNTSSRASYPAQYIVYHAGGTTTILKSQRDGTSGSYVSFELGDFDLGTTGRVRVNDTGCESITFNKMRFTYLGIASPKATSPTPPDGATGVPLTAGLSWLAGLGATSSDVYFGTTGPGTYRGNFTDIAYVPGPLLPLTTYFWRIDSVGPGGTVTGDVWRFTTGSGTFTYSTQYEFDADPSTAAGVLDANAGDANGNGVLVKSGTGWGNAGGGIANGILRFVDSTSSGNQGYHFAGNGSALSFTVDMRVRVNDGVLGTTLRRSMGFSAGPSKNIGLRLHKTNDGSGACADGSVRFAVGTGGTGVEGCVSFGEFRRLRVSVNATTNTFRIFDLDARIELSSASGGGGGSLAWANEINNLGGYHIGSISGSNTTLTDFEVDYFRVLLGTAIEDAATIIHPISPPCNHPPQDVEEDGDVDLTDFGVFQACFNGPNRPWPEGADADACRCIDADEDGDVDLSDFGVFQVCFNGPNRTPPQPACDTANGVEG